MVQQALDTSIMSFQTITPIDNSVYLERAYNTQNDIEAALERASKAQQDWRNVPLKEKQEALLKVLAYFKENIDELAEELTWQIGRPISQTPNEIKGLCQRGQYMVDLAPQALADIVPEQEAGVKKYVARDPLGVVAVIAPWNYPYLTSVNAIFPALLSGNTVILKHSNQTPLVADRYEMAMQSAGVPEGVFQKLDLSHEDTEKMIADNRINFVNFTGSVKGGHVIQKAICNKFISAGLELGGKDPAYVRQDANLNAAIEGLVDGAFFNTGQACCGIERIYVHKSVFEEFVNGFVDLTNQYKLGNPMDPDINLGPMIRSSAAEFVRGQVNEAIDQGAKALINELDFEKSKDGTPYLAPQVLVNVNHNMRVMYEESFGPVVGIMSVESDVDAIEKMNDSEFGLTASVWSKDEDSALEIGKKIETGTFYMNRCDYLDPALAWTGVKNTGRGCTLSSVGFEQLTRPKSYYLKEGD